MYKSFLLLAFLFPTLTFAHGIGEVYKLPIPIDYYLISSAIVVFLSFLVSPVLSKNLLNFSKKELAVSGKMQILFSSILLFSIFLTILTGLFGTINVSKNFSVIFFWIYFMIFMSTLSFIFGGIWDIINPWKLLNKSILKISSGQLPIPIITPVIFIFIYYWFELISGNSFVPQSVGLALLMYTIINILGDKFFGNWFKKGDFLSIYFNFISQFSIYSIKTENSDVNLKPFLNYPISAFIFVCILLAGISFDSISETLFWYSITEYLNIDYDSKFTGTLGLILSILPFATLYIVSIFLISKLTTQITTLKSLIKEYLPSLSPIVFGYFLAHNFSVFIVSIPIFLPTLLDPFGLGWNLFGVNSIRFSPIILETKFIWYIEIFFIVFGHVLAVIMSHFISKKIFTNKKDIFLADLLFIPLMLVYTIITLWLISLPLVSF
jgi:hypothetical protein